MHRECIGLLILLMWRPHNLWQSDLHFKVDKGGCVFEGSIWCCICEVSLVTRLESAKNSSSRYWKCFWNKWGFQYVSKYLYQLSPGSDLSSDWICTLRSRILIWTGIKYCLPALKHTSLKLSYPYHKQIWMRIKAKKVFPFQMLTGYGRMVGGNASEQKGSWKYQLAVEVG